MAYTQPIVGTVTLPHVSTFSYESAHRGAMVEMADGTVAFDVVATGVKNTWTLKWEAISDTNKGIVATVYAALATSSAAMTTPTGGSVTVTRTNRAPQFDPVYTRAGLRWNVELELREV